MPKNQFDFFFVFQNYVTESVSEALISKGHLFILTEIFLINGLPLLTLKS